MKTSKRIGSGKEEPRVALWSLYLSSTTPLIPDHRLSSCFQKVRSAKQRSRPLDRAVDTVACVILVPAFVSIDIAGTTDHATDVAGAALADGVLAVSLRTEGRVDAASTDQDADRRGSRLF